MKYRSGFEQQIADHLDVLEIPYEYEPESWTYFKEAKGYCPVCENESILVQHTYTPDFRICISGTNTYIYLEGKGKFTSEERTKMLAVVKQYPELDIRMIFQRDNWLRKTRKTRYTGWCKQKKIKACLLKDLTPEWLATSDL